MNIGIFITVRSGSTRLQAKALRPVNGLPIISYLIERIKYILRNSVSLYICTTTLPEDNIFDNIALTHGITAYHGNPDNILKRHLDCALQEGIDFIINVDGDDILCNTEYINKAIEILQSTPQITILKTAGLPFGTNCIGYSTQTLRETVKKHDFSVIDTGWSELIYDNNMHLVKILEADAVDQMPNLRLTLDYEEDFEVFRHILETLFTQDRYVPQAEILSYLKQHPEISKLNSHLSEQYWKRYYQMRQEEKSTWEVEDKQK